MPSVGGKENSMRIRRTAIACAALAAVWIAGEGDVSVAGAAQTFDERTTFLNTVGGVFEMEGFEAPFPVENPHDFGPFTVTGAGDVDTAHTVSQDTFYFTEGMASMLVKSDADLTIDGFTSATFSFDSPITSFGVDILGFGLSSFFKGILTVSNDGTLGALTIGDNTGGALDPGNVIFFGVHDTMEFSNLSFTWTTRGDGLAFDNLKYQAGNPLPEPATLPAALALLGLLNLKHRRRVRAGVNV
jgi:hypothetical protein